MKDRVFDLDEAESMIPWLEIVIEKLQCCVRQLTDHVASVEPGSGESDVAIELPELLRLRPDLGSLIEEMNRLVDEIETSGCMFRDLELGLVDFPAEVAGEDAYLCWQYGEKTIAFWHPVAEGLAGRRPLESRPGGQPRYLQ